MNRWWPALLLLAAACSSFSNNDDGIVSLEVRLPTNFALELGLPLQLHAVARNADGDSVGVELSWLTPDTTVAVDPSGLVTPLQSSGMARIQVGVLGKDTLLSAADNLTFTLTPYADSLRLLGSDSLEVETDADVSPALDVALVDTAAQAGVPGRPIGFAIVEPAADSASPVVLRTSKVRDSALSGPSGGPATPMTVQAARGKTPPDRVVVEVTAYHATGAPIPGSGRRIVIRFLHH